LRSNFWRACLSSSWLSAAKPTHHGRSASGKRVPLVVGNLGPATFGRDDNTLVLVDAHGHRELPSGDKLTLARALVAEVAARLPSQLDFGTPA
jgi:phosphopantothenoylcysteine decarboxylase / phosphopantothenate---cysteine ligase